MKINIKRTRKGMTITFKAERDPEGQDLKTAVLAAVGEGGFTPVKVIDELEKLGYGGPEKPPAKARKRKKAPK